MIINTKDITEEDALWKDLLCTHYNLHYNKSNHQQGMVNLLQSLCGQELEKEVRCLVTNLYRMVKVRAKYMKITRDRKEYTGNTQGLSYARSMRLLDRLEELNMVNLYIGGVSEWENGIAKAFLSSILEPKEKLMKLMVETKAIIDTDYKNPVEIKQRDSKKMLTTQGVKGVKEIKEKVEMFNTALIESRISLKGIELPDQKYKRGFIDNLKTGGRWYNTVGGVQTMDKTLRPFLQIDGEDLIELDFSAIHPSICYQLIDADLPKGFDPYGVDLWEEFVDPEAVARFKIRHGLVKYDPGRNLVKMAVMIGLNCSKLSQAKRALSQHFGRDKSKWNTQNEYKSKYYGMIELDWEKVLTSVQKYNSLISHYFFSDIGVKLQYIDSEILEYVICETLAIDEVLLPWHDGVMVKKAIAEQVKGFMYKAWHKQFGSIKFCKVDEK